jgi:hypothetical protein
MYATVHRIAVGLVFLGGWPSAAAGDAPHQEPLPRDPHDARRLENDVVGVRVWGPPTQPTLSLGKSDIWDRRWFAERQPLVTMAKIRELAMADRLAEVARQPNDTAYSGLYHNYDFPCPKPGAQVILGTPFGSSVRVGPGEHRGVRMVVAGGGKRLTADVWVALARPLVVIELRPEGLQPGDFWLRVHRHHDTIVPGEPVSPTVGGRPSATDFERLPAPRAFAAEGRWGIVQQFPGEMTFPQGFCVVAAVATIGAEGTAECREGEQRLGTPLWAEKEGRLNHGIVKRYAPINSAPGAAATGKFASLPGSFTALATIATSQDGTDPAAVAAGCLNEARTLGLEGLRREDAQTAERCRRRLVARARIGGQVRLAAPEFVAPSLRRADGYYGDVPLCSVGSTKFCFQDAGLWHDDFHLNEIRAESMVTLGQYEELLPYCQLIRTLLPQAQENARDVYGLPGAMYPLVHFPLRCRGVAHTNLTWEQDMGLNGLVAKPLWLCYRHTGEKAFLRDVAYPVLREGARFLCAYLAAEADGRLHLVPTVSPEHWGLTPRFERNRDCTSALTLTRYLLRAAAAAAVELQVDAREAAAWRAAAERLAPYPTFATPDGPVWVDVAGAPPIQYNIPVPLAPVFWGDDVGLDSPAETLALAKRTLARIDVWPPHRGYLGSCVRPRLGMVELGASLEPEHLLLSYQSIHLFPAVPPSLEIVMENFAAEGGFRVSAVRTAAGEIRDVQVHSTRDGECRLANPWPARAVEATSADGTRVAAFDLGQAGLAFPTQPSGTYRLRPLP